MQWNGLKRSFHRVPKITEDPNPKSVIHMNMRWKVWGLIMLLIGSIVPMGFSFAGSNTTQLNQTVLNIDNETREQLISARLINQLDKISSIVEG